MTRRAIGATTTHFTHGHRRSKASRSGNEIAKSSIAVGHRLDASG